MKACWFLALFLVLLILPPVQATDSFWTEANQAYAAGRFEEAKANYLQLVDRRSYSGPLFLNLGNTWFRLGDAGRAILNYERALLLRPQSLAASVNLQTAMRAAGTEPRNSFQQFLNKHPDYFPLAAAAAFWLTAAGVCTWLLGPRKWRFRGRTLAAGGGLVFLLSMGLWLWIGSGAKDTRRALVIESQAELKLGPANSARVAESLGVGDQVRLVAKRGAWTLCQSESGTTGWILTRKIETVVPE